MMYQESGITKRELRKIMNGEVERIKSGAKHTERKTVEDYERDFIRNRPAKYQYKAVILYEKGAGLPETNSLEMITETIATAIVKGYHGRMYTRTETGYRTVKEF